MREKEILVFEECPFSKYVFYRIYFSSKDCSISMYTLKDRNFEYICHKATQDEALVIISRCKSINLEYSELFSLFLRNIKESVKSILNMILDDEEYLDAMEDGRYICTFSSYDVYDSNTAIESNYKFDHDECFFCIEENYFKGYDIDYIHKPPYKVDVEIPQDEINWKHKEIIIEENVYKVIKNCTLSFMDIWYELCHCISLTIENK